MSQDPDVIIGVDNGLGGGLCALSRHNGSIISHRAMPLREVSGKLEVDVMTLLDFITQVSPMGRTVVGLEEPLKHAKSSQSMRSMALGFGLISGALEAKSVSCIRIQVSEWQKPMLGKRPQGQTKQIAEKKARLLWPDESWLKNPQCRTPHDGIIDAALIAHYLLGTLR